MVVLLYEIFKMLSNLTWKKVFCLNLIAMTTQIKNNKNGENYRMRSIRNDFIQSSYQWQIVSILDFPYMHNTSA
jgi:hypothetical protein